MGDTFEEDVVVHVFSDGVYGFDDAPDAPAMAENTFMVKAPALIQNLNVIAATNFGTATRSESGWSHAQDGNAFVYAGTADRVDIVVQTHQQIPGTVNRQRPSPILELLKDGAVVATSATGYIRDTIDHEESSFTLVWTDESPGTGATYTVQTRRDTTNTGAVDLVTGDFVGKAVHKVEVLTP